MIDYQILEDQGIVILEPSGPLRKEDFENLTRDEAWTKGSVARLSLERTLCPRGRPKKLRKES